MRARPAQGLRGTLTPPGDKSISHRAVILAAMAEGVSEIAGLLEGADVKATLHAAQALGAQCERTGAGAWRITGASWRNPGDVLDMGNSGTGVRLLAGAAAGYRLEARFDGDASLRSRPMERIADPLRLMGADIETQDGRLPLRLRGGGLTGIAYDSPVASAQIKSAILLAGLNADGGTTVREPAPSRDHTERLLPVFGGAVRMEGGAVSVPGGQRLSATRLAVPGDPSSAAFPLAAALLVPGSEAALEGVLLNPRRAGLFSAWKRMGADLQIEPRDGEGEPAGRLTARAGGLNGLHVTAEDIPAMIDEIPILAVTCAFAEGVSRLEGLAELRVKESDRLAAVADLLRGNGVACETGEDWIEIEGRGPGGVAGGGVAETRGDHRIAMAGLILGLASRDGTAIDDAAMIDTSYPQFFEHMAALGAEMESA